MITAPAYDGLRAHRRLDHLVLTVADIDAAVEFYSRVLGMTVVTFGTGRTALAFDRSKVNVHKAATSSSRRPAARRPAAGHSPFPCACPSGAPVITCKG